MRGSRIASFASQSTATRRPLTVDVMRDASNAHPATKCNASDNPRKSGKIVKGFSTYEYQYLSTSKVVVSIRQHEYTMITLQVNRFTLCKRKKETCKRKYVHPIPGVDSSLDEGADQVLTTPQGRFPFSAKSTCLGSGGARMWGGGENEFWETTNHPPTHSHPVLYLQYIETKREPVVLAAGAVDAVFRTTCTGPWNRGESCRPSRTCPCTTTTAKCPSGTIPSGEASGVPRHVTSRHNDV